MKLSGKIKDKNLIVKAKTFFGENIEQKELEEFAIHRVQGFMKPKVVKRSSAEYTAPIAISLYEYLQRPITKFDFFFIVEQIVVAVQNLQKEKYSLDKVVTDVKYIYINEVAKEIQMIYLPMSVPKSSTNLIELLETIVYLVKPETGQSTEYISRFIYFLKGLKANDIELIEEYIYKEEAEVVHIIRGETISKKKEVKYQEKVIEKTEEKIAVPEKKKVVEPKRKFVIVDEEKTITETEDTLLEDDKTIVEDDRTILQKDMYKFPKTNRTHFPKLIRTLSNETIKIDKPIFRLGRGAEVDYSIDDNRSVGHNHANIISKGNQYFVIDLKSKNGTYVNEDLLVPNAERQLQDGDSLKLSNEEFRFKL